MTVRVWGCARHAQIGRTCCQDTEILLSEGDLARIAAHTGRTDFHETVPVANPEYAPDDSDPTWRSGFHADGTRPVLRHAAGGDCTFLGERGCTLPLDVRPLVCRIYPYTHDEHGVGPVSTQCPAEVAPPGRSVTEALGLERTDAVQWHAQLYAELRAHPRSVRPESRG
ncbi:MAG: YkgJ family cysteine cluster protein [Myxococcota bacterium]